MSSPCGEPWFLRFLRPKVAIDALGWMLLAGLPFAIHAFHVVDVPSVAEPFDVETFDKGHVAPEDNAWSLYWQAVEQLVPMCAAAKDEYDKTLEQGAAAIGESLKEAIASNQTALALFREGSERPAFQSPRHAESGLQLDHAVNSNIRQLGRLTEVQALLLQEAGDVESAWDCLHSNLRCGRHLGQNSDSNGRLTGRDFQVRTTRGIVQWAESPWVDAPLLRRALDDARAAYAMTPPMSTAFKFDYLFARHICDTPALQDSGLNQQLFLNCLEWEGRWFLGEPELSRTVVRAAFANWLSQCDKPHFERSPQDDWGFFATASATTTGTAALAPDVIARLLRRSLVARPLICPQPNVFKWLDTESAWQAILELLLATHIHHRETGAFPESAEELVGAAVDDLPIDPFARDPKGNAARLRYRREADPAEGVTLWSIGPDGIDDDGRLKYPASVGHDSERGDVLISIKPPPRR